MTGIAVFAFGVAPSFVPATSYAWGLNSRTTETEQDPNWKNESRGDPLSRENVKKILKKTFEYFSPERGKVINPLLDIYDKGLERGNYPGTNGGIWNQKRDRMQQER